MRSLLIMHVYKVGGLQSLSNRWLTLAMFCFLLNPTEIKAQEEFVPSCSLSGIEELPTSSILQRDGRTWAIFNDPFEVTANVAVKLSLSSITVISEPTGLTMNTRPIANIRDVDNGINRMLSPWASKDSASSTANAQNTIDQPSRYQVLGYMYNLSAPGLYKYSVTVNCLM